MLLHGDYTAEKRIKNGRLIRSAKLIVFLLCCFLFFLLLEILFCFSLPKFGIVAYSAAIVSRIDKLKDSCF